MADFSDLAGANGQSGRFVVRLEALELRIGLGIHPAERAAPQRVIVSVLLYCDYGAQPLADDIGAVVDYDFLRGEITALARSRHFELQESLCEAIGALALADPRVAGVRVRTEKPEIYPDARIGCEIVRVSPLTP